VREKFEELPAPTPGPARPVEAGTSYNDAPVLAAGSYRDSITTGETRYFRVRLDWGQRLAYRMTVPTQQVPIQSAALYVGVASPLRAKAEQTAGSDSSVLLGGREDQEVSGSTTAPVRYLNRDSTRYQARGYSVDGYYYLVLDLSYRLGQQEPLSFPFTLTVATSGGEPGPRYVTDPDGYGGATTSPPAQSPGQAGSAGGSGTAAAESGGPAGWVLAAAGGAGVMVAAAVVLVLWRRRSRRVS
jgi:Ca-activated chloride channel homolog